MQKCVACICKIRRSVRLLAVLFVTLVLFVPGASGAVYMGLLMEPCSTVASPPVALEAGTAGSWLIYANETSAKVGAVAPVSTPPTYYPSGNNIVTGAYVSGSVPASVNTTDSNYFVVRSSGTATSTTAYNPSSYSLLGSTTLVSGSTSDLTSNDGFYMTFRSYRNAYTKYATTSGAVGFSNPTYVQGAPDSVGASRSGGADNDYVYGGGFATETGNVGQVIIRMRYYVTTASTSDQVRVSYRVSGNLGTTTSGWFLPTATSWTNVDVDVTADRSWTWTDISNTRVYCDYDKVLGPDSWTIYVDVLHVLVYSSYISEVEFIGSSNTYTWAQLVWTVDSAWSTGSVAVTIQLYNYTSPGGYSTSGDGYDSYTSSATADTDQTRTKTVTTNPQHFRNGTGYWKIKVKGEKSTTTQFDFKADLVEFKPTYYSQYTVSTEFLFSSMTTNTPTQLNFTIVSEYDTGSVNITIQVWNYSSSPQAYVTSGQGYLTYFSSGVNETKTLNITTNPQFYTSNGNAKIKITGVLTTTTQYNQRANQIKLLYNYSSQPNYDYVLKIVNKDPASWKIRLRAYSESKKERLDNCTIYFHNSSDGTSRQIYIENGDYVNQTGPWYDLPVSPAERYIAVTLQANNSEVSHVYVYLEILVPDRTTYAQYVITFEIT